jgi:hypothetical protein
MVIISTKSIINGLPEHPDLLKLTDQSMEECSILSGAKLNMVPIASSHNKTASEQVTLVTSVGKTSCSCHQAMALRRSIESLWHNESFMAQISSAGHDRAEEHFSDEAAGRHFARALDDVLNEGA